MTLKEFLWDLQSMVVESELELWGDLSASLLASMIQNCELQSLCGIGAHNQR